MHRQEGIRAYLCPEHLQKAHHFPFRQEPQNSSLLCMSLIGNIFADANVTRFSIKAWESVSSMKEHGKVRENSSVHCISLCNFSVKCCFQLSLPYACFLLSSSVCCPAVSIYDTMPIIKATHTTIYPVNTIYF